MRVLSGHGQQQPKDAIMTVHFHEEDLPADVLAPTGRLPSTPRRWA